MTGNRLERVWDSLVRVKDSASEDAVVDVAREVRCEYWQLEDVLSGLEGRDEVSLSELQEIERFVGEIEDRLDDHAEELEKCDSLSDRVQELSERRDNLRSSVDDLETQCEELTQAKNQLLETVEDLKEDERPYKQGYEDGWNDGTPTVPCSHCGDPIPVKPGSPPHDSIVEVLLETGWGHPSCRSRRVKH